MRALLMTAAVLAVAFAAQVPANAQTPASAYRYCLQESGGPHSPGTTLCRYHTLAQCWASKTSPGDLCYRNPGYRGKN